MNDNTVQSDRAYTCSGCGKFHAFKADPATFHGGIIKTCDCGVSNELWRDANLGETQAAKTGKLWEPRT